MSYFYDKAEPFLISFIVFCESFQSIFNKIFLHVSYDQLPSILFS
jgi:hypothetical protein